MRQHERSATMQSLRAARLALGAALLFGAPGCAQYYYYPYPGGACAPTMVVPGAVQNGQVCDVPSTVNGGTVVSGRGLTSTPILGGARPPSVVLSQPRTGGSLLGWRPADSEGSPAITRVEGALDDPTVTR
jgi:hypothetical protein